MKRIKSLLLGNHNTKQILVKNSLWLGLVEAVSKVIMFAVTILVVRYFGAMDFGRLNYAQAFVGMIMLLSDFGLNTILIRDIAKDKTHASSYLKSAMVVKAISSLLVMLVLSIATPLFSSTRGDISLFILMGIFLLSQSLEGIFNSVLSAYEAMELIFVSRITHYVGILASALIVVGLRLDLHALIIAYAISALLCVAVTIFALRRVGVNLRAPFDMALTKRLLLESLPIFGMLAISQVYLNLDTVLIRINHGALAVGYYQAAYKILFAFQAINLISTATFPRISALYHQGEIDKLKKLARMVLIGTSAVFIPFIGLVFAFAPLVVTRIYGESYLPSAVVLPILFSAGLVMFYRTFIGNFFMAAGKQKLVFRAALLALTINAALNYYLIPRYGIVAGGVALLSSELFGILSLILFGLFLRRR